MIIWQAVFSSMAILNVHVKNYFHHAVGRNTFLAESVRAQIQSCITIDIVPIAAKTGYPLNLILKLLAVDD